MALSNDKTAMIQRAAGEMEAGFTVNLGIGLPTRIVDYIPSGLPVCLHSENGITGVGPVAVRGEEDRNLIDAGGAYVSSLPGSAFIDSATSFALIRSGRVNLSVLGALQVGSNGDLANWAVPGSFTPGLGGGAELAQKAGRVVVVMTHVDKRGNPKIVEKVSLPLTASACVNRIYTDLAVIDVTDQGLALRELAEGISIDEVLSKTAAPLQVYDKALPTF